MLFSLVSVDYLVVLGRIEVRFDISLVGLRF